MKLNSYAWRQSTLCKAMLAGALLVVAAVTLVPYAGASASVRMTFGSITVTDIGTTTASVSSSVNPEGADTTVWFTYGVSSNVPPTGSNTPVQDVGAGTTSVSLSASLTGLTADTTYYVWLVANTTTGTTGWSVPYTTFTTVGPTTTVGSITPNSSVMTMHDTRLGLGLTAVSCPTATQCLATGLVATSETRSVAVIDQLSNGTWASSPTPVLTKENLSGIDCPSAASCEAVGSIMTPSGDAPFAMHYNGRIWTRVSVPTPLSFGANYLSAVTCPSTTSCWAVGGKEGATSLGRELIEHYNGRSWSIVASPGPADDSLLSSVSCTSASSCWAVGVGNDIAVASKTGSLIEHYNGHSWSRASAPNVVGGLSSVSCQSSAACFATGLRYSGGAWRRVSGIGALSAISCSSSSSCWEGDYNGQAQFWNGTSWSLVAGPTFPSGHAGQLDAVSCSTGGPCVAVGSVWPITSSGGTARGAEFKIQALAELLAVGQS